ncbi:MAG: hypothetical protein J4G03_08630 [Gemmatimonadetes bacterium]|nr:hypothetical protein [Gemmatimonadota bacterium]
MVHFVTRDTHSWVIGVQVVEVMDDIVAVTERKMAGCEGRADERGELRAPELL